MTRLSLLVVLAGCSERPHALEVEVRFDDPALAERAVLVEVTVLEGGCTGPTVATRNLRAGLPIDPPLRLGTGLHGFTAVARDAACAVIATACVVRTLPLRDGDVVPLELGEVAPEPCRGECTDGVCEGGGADAGPADAGPDADGGFCETGEPENCAFCGDRCPTDPEGHGRPDCLFGECRLDCFFPEYLDCDGDGDCDFLGDVARCGGCMTGCGGAMPVCAPADGGFACASGCGGARLCSDGSCVGSVAHCSDCDRSCLGAGAMCVGGECRCASGTLCPFGDNDFACVDTETDPNNCDMCGHVCTPPTDGRAECVAGGCVPVCDPPRMLVCDRCVRFATTDAGPCS